MPKRKPTSTNAARTRNTKRKTRPTKTARKNPYFKDEETIAPLLNSIMGPLSEMDVMRWGRRAYLQLVGMLYMRMKAGANIVSTPELLSLSKALADNRRIENQARDADGHVEYTRGTDRTSEAFPPILAAAVRRVYGVNLQPDVKRLEDAGPVSDTDPVSSDTAENASPSPEDGGKSTGSTR